MTGAQFGSAILGLVVVAIVVAIVVWLMNWLVPCARRRSALRAHRPRRPEGGDERRALRAADRHEVVPVNMNTLRLEVSRGRDKALITKDRMRVDVVSEFYVPRAAGPDAIASRAQTLGQRTLEPETLKELVEGKFVDALPHGGGRDEPWEELTRSGASTSSG